MLKYDFHIFKVMRDGQIYNRLMSNFLWMSAPITIKIELFFYRVIQKSENGKRFETVYNDKSQLNIVVNG